LNHIYAQVIDDQTGRTLVCASSLSPELSQEQGFSGGNREGAKKVGALLGKKAITAGITKICFDRGGYRYHGRVKALAEAARECGLEF